MGNKLNQVQYNQYRSHHEEEERRQQFHNQDRSEDRIALHHFQNRAGLPVPNNNHYPPAVVTTSHQQQNMQQLMMLLMQSHVATTRQQTENQEHRQSLASPNSGNMGHANSSEPSLLALLGSHQEVSLPRVSHQDVSLPQRLQLQGIAATIEQLQRQLQGNATLPVNATSASSSETPNMVFGNNESNFVDRLRSSTVEDFVPESVSTRALPPGSEIMPCKARGLLTADHNAKTAYFVIPKDIKHGDGLECSHIQCQNKGIRFVFCKVCKTPVAKANFSTRHLHQEEEAMSSMNGSLGKKRSFMTYDEASNELAGEEGNQYNWSTENDSPASNFARAVRMTTNPADNTGRDMNAAASPIARNSHTTIPSNVSSNTSSSQECANGDIHSRMCLTVLPVNSVARGSSPDDAAMVCQGENNENYHRDSPSTDLRVSDEIESKWLALLDARPPNSDEVNVRVWLKAVYQFANDSDNFSSEHYGHEQERKKRRRVRQRAGASPHGPPNRAQRQPEQETGSAMVASNANSSNVGTSVTASSNEESDLNHVSLHPDTDGINVAKRRQSSTTRENREEGDRDDDSMMSNESSCASASSSGSALSR